MDGRATSALLMLPPGARAALVFAHGAGAGMGHWFMEEAANALARRGVATLRFDFPFMHAGKKRPDQPAVAQAAVRAAVDAATRAAPGLPLFAGGKSFGGRMTSQAQAVAPLPGVRGLVFFGFPLHPRNRPSTARAEHLRNVDLPMLFLQGGRDALADYELIAGVCSWHADRATLHVIEAADHGFEAPARARRPRAAIIAELTDHASDWMTAHAG